MRKALSNKNSPRRLHLGFYLLIWLAMDRAQPPMWAWGAVGAVCAVMFLVTLVDFFSAQDVELK